MSRPPSVRSREHRVLVRRVPLRMPFHFGAVTMTELELCALRLTVEVDGRVVEGETESVLSPLWFDRDPRRAPGDKRAALLDALVSAARAVEEAGAGTLAELHRDTAGVERPLVASFGVALVDAALLDAACRATGAPPHVLLGRPAPADGVAVRHTVGLDDPLDASEARPRLDDLLPETLEEAAREYGLAYFKVKVDADVERAAARLRRIHAVLARVAPGYALTLDGNETLADVDSLARFVERLAGDPALAEPWGRTLWIEQPLAREVALAGPLPPLPKPVVIDESDATDDAVERAFALGYAGTSAKTCKGLHRTLHSARAVDRRPGAILACEDLTTVPLLGLHHDLALVATVGATHVERNGHHYVRGLSHLTARERDAALRGMPGLYRTLADGTPALRIERGRLDLTGLNAAAFGGDVRPDWSAYREP